MTRSRILARAAIRAARATLGIPATTTTED
jgi:hypothetical protein